MPARILPLTKHARAHPLAPVPIPHRVGRMERWEGEGGWLGKVPVRSGAAHTAGEEGDVGAGDSEGVM